MRRRLFLRLTVFGSILAAGGTYSYRVWRHRPARALSPEEKAALTAIIDLLAPSDELSPGALELSVQEQVIKEAEGDAAIRRRFRAGLTWLDAQAAPWGSGFGALPARRQTELLRRCEGLPDRSPLGRFFRELRDLTFGYYYSRPETWPAIGYSGPPQPLGYPEYTDPPRTAS